MTTTPPPTSTVRRAPRGLAALLLVHFVLGAFVGPATAQQAYCAKCDNTGRIESKAWEKIRKEIEEFGLQDEPRLLVSFHIEQDRDGRGLDALPCERCRAPEVTKEAREALERQAKEREAWLAERRKIDALVKPRGDLAHVETEHFRLTFGIRKITLEDKRTFRTEQAALLYAKRLEDFYDWFQQLLGYTDEQARVTRHDVFLMGDLRTLMGVAHEYCNLPTDRAARAVGDPSVLCTWPETGVYRRDGDFHRHVLYHVSHLLVGVYYMKVWLVENAGWLEEGLAHLVEMDLFQVAGNTSNVEQSEPDRGDADWEPEVRELIVKNRLVPFADLIRKRADQLTGVEHKLAWSYVDFLHAKGGGEKIAAMIQDIKKNGELDQVRDALRAHFGLTVTSIEGEWIEWVRANYRSKP